MTRMSINEVSPEEWDALTRHCKVAKKSIVVEAVSPIKQDIRSTITTDAKARKAIPIHTTLFKYWPDAVAALAECCVVGGAQHGQEVSELHWDRAKSGNELDAMMRHALDAGYLDTDQIRHSTKILFRAFCNLQLELEKAKSSGS